MNKDLNEVKGNLKKYIAEAIARFQIENGIPVDNYRNWIIACQYGEDYLTNP